MVVLDHTGAEHVFEGQCGGQLRHTLAGGGGFGYDPLFVPTGETCTFAELSEARKNQISHRARALQKLVAWVQSKR